jgi:hypothetical protein
VPSKREDRSDQKKGDQPQGREAEDEEYPSGELRPHNPKEIMGFAGAGRFDAKDRVLGMKGKEAHSQNDGDEQEDDCPNFLPHGSYT